MNTNQSILVAKLFHSSNAWSRTKPTQSHAHHNHQMASTQLSDQVFRPIPAVCVSLRRLSTTKPNKLPCHPRSKALKHKHLGLQTTQNYSKWAVRLSLVDQSPPKSTVDMERVVDFLYQDLVHLFDDQGIDRTAYDERVKFRDPITKHDSITGYLLNIAFLKTVFTPKFQLHWVKQVTVSRTCVLSLIRLTTRILGILGIE